MAIPNKILKIPFSDSITESAGKVSRPWQQFFIFLKEIVDPQGYEKSFALVNNQSSDANIDEMNFDQATVSFACIEYIIHRLTTSTGQTSLTECGAFILAFKPLSEWTINHIYKDSPDDSGIDFKLKQVEKYSATYNHTTGTWTKSAHGLYDGNAVTLTTTSALPTGYSVNTTYYVINSATNTFKLSATKGGAAVTAATDSGTGTQKINMSSGQVQYTSSNISGTASISKITWRARTLGGKNYQYSQVGVR